MQPPLFYAPPERRDGDTIKLPAEEAKHAARVLRLGIGVIVVVVDGLGRAYRAELTSISQRKTTVRIHSEIRDLGEPAVRLTLAVGLAAGSGFDSVIQCGTELGVSRFVPLLTAKSKVAVDDARRAASKVTRWRKVAVAAMKQCRRSLIPQIADPTAFDDFLHQYDRSDKGVMFHPGKYSLPLEEVPLDSGIKRLTMLVGPESGFTDDEAALAEENGFALVSLGRRVLRTGTAGLVVVALVMARLGEFR